MKSHLLRKMVLTVVSLVLLILVTACAGVGTNANGSITSVTGTITNIDTVNHTVTLSVGGTSYTIKGLSDQTVQTLQNQVGKTYTVQVTQNSDGSYSVTVGTNPTLAVNQTPGVSGPSEGNETPEASETPNATETGNAAGSIYVIAVAQNVSSSSLTVTLPDSTALTIAINAQTDKSHLDNGTVSNGQKVIIEANASSSGFSATKIKPADNGDDINTVEFKGATTQALGADHILHFTVGNHQFSYTLGSHVDLDTFNNSTVPSGTSVKVTVEFNGTTGTITKVSSND